MLTETLKQVFKLTDSLIIVYVVGNVIIIEASFTFRLKI